MRQGSNSRLNWLKKKQNRKRRWRKQTNRFLPFHQKIRKRQCRSTVKEYFKDTNLKRIRASYGCTQAELAKHSGVSLRSIQMYEQRNKDINKASTETLYRISKVLGCTIEDLLEK